MVKVDGLSRTVIRLMGGCSLTPPYLEKHIEEATVRDLDLPRIAPIEPYLYKRGALSSAATEADEVSPIEEIFLS